MADTLTATVTSDGKDLLPTPPPRRKSRTTLLKKLQRFELGKSIDNLVSYCKESRGQEAASARREERVCSRSATTTPTPPPRRKKTSLLHKKAQRLELERSLDSAITLCERSPPQEEGVEVEHLGSVSEEAASPVTTPTPPPRRKRRTLLKKLQRLELEKSVDSIVSCCNIDDKTRSQSHEAARHERLARLQGYRLRASSANDIYKVTSAASVASTSTCSFDCSISSTAMDSELESSDIFIEADSLMIKSAKFSPRNENYYSGSEMRRQSEPTSDSKVRQTSFKMRSVSLSPSTAEKSPSHQSPSHSPRHARSPRSPAPPRPSSGPSRPPRPPSTTLAQGCTNKTAPYSQLYASTYQALQTDTLVIDTKYLAGTDHKVKQRTLPRSYGRKCEPLGGGTPTKNRDDAAIVYGKRTQAVMNKLVATVKMFNKSSSSGDQKTTKPEKKPLSKTPPQRPPPAVRNTPRPRIPKSVLFGEESTEDNLYVNEYDDHIYMEVGLAGYKSKQMKCYSESSPGSRVDEVGKEEDPYVIMNPGSDSHVYTSLDFGTRNEPKGEMRLCR